MNDQKTIVYMLSGLGLDPAIFQNLTIEADEIHHLHWLEPEQNETLKSYAKRMAEGIGEHEGKLVLIGHSFGGVLMQEMSLLVPADQIILISSIKAKEEKTAAMNFWMRAFPLHYMASQKLILTTFKSWGKKQGYDSPEAQTVFLNAAAQHSSYYFRWATSRICEWKAPNVRTPIVHIHGTKDKTFPHRNIKEPVLLIEGGSHVMVFTQAAAVSALINQNIKKVAPKDNL